MDGISLPPGLEAFAAEAVASGAYRDTAAVVTAGIRLLKQQRAARDLVVKSLEDAEAESDREGWFSLDEILTETDKIVAGSDKTGDATSSVFSCGATRVHEGVARAGSYRREQALAVGRRGANRPGGCLWTLNCE